MRGKGLGLLRWEIGGYSSSLISQSDHGIDFHGPLRRNVACSHGDEHQHNSDTRKRERIVGGDAKKFAGHELRKAERPDDADAYPNGRHARALSKNKAQNIAALSPEREAHSNLVNALTDRVSDNGIETEHCQ